MGLEKSTDMNIKTKQFEAPLGCTEVESEISGWAESFRSLFGRCAGVLSCLRRERREPPSVLRNNTNLPVFLAIALSLSLVCNLVLRESSAQASRHSGAMTTIDEVRKLVADNPDDAGLHSRLGELYVQQRNFKRAMFHFRESSRLLELYGE